MEKFIPTTTPIASNSLHAFWEKLLCPIAILLILNGKKDFRPVFNQTVGNKKSDALFIGNTGNQKCFS